MKKVYVFWFNRYVNLGDILGPWIVQKLINDKGLEVEYSVNVTKLESLRIILGALLRFRLPEWKYIKRLFITQPVLLTVGSILDQCHTDCTVWGAGFQNENEICEKGKIVAVRGYETVKRLKDIGFLIPDNIAIGDPAILLPLLYLPKVEKRYKLGIVMHVNDKDYIQEHFSMYHLIDVETDDVTGFMDDLCSCEYILTTSLHGLILAHSYGIPALWMRKNWIGSDGFKFRDYFSSVSLYFQDSLDADCIAGMSEERILELFAIRPSLPKSEVMASIRQGLLESFPY